jgi:hypothetical protein
MTTLELYSMSQRSLPGSSDQPVGFHHHVGVFNLRTQGKADEYECRAEHRANDRNAPKGLPVGLVEGWRQGRCHKLFFELAVFAGREHLAQPATAATRSGF